MNNPFSLLSNVQRACERQGPGIASPAQNRRRNTALI